jgi:3-oxoacyl-[acyl-carrier-protein] synthase II
VVTGMPRPIGPGPALSTSFGFGGHDTTLVLSAP